jgi:isoleucyl-tRNA synthetase
VRRNRRRFWKSAMGEDKLSAYQTLYETLFTVVKLIAPFVPFLSEEMYQNLNSMGTEKWESVHLSVYPSREDTAYRFSDPQLEEKMDLVKNVVSMCRSARNEAKIRVRQPLSQVVIVAGSSKREAAIQSLASVIKEEVNVRALAFMDSSDQIMTKRAKPNFKTIGPKFGQKVNEAKSLIQNLTVDEIERIEKGGTIQLKEDHHSLGKIDQNDIEIAVEAKSGLVVQSNGNLTVALDITLDSDLLEEGLAREFVNRVQNMRKQAGFDVTDRIQIYYDSTENMLQAIQKKDQYICEETLAVHLDNQFQEGDYCKEWEIEDEKIKVGIERVQQ